MNFPTLEYGDAFCAAWNRARCGYPKKWKSKEAHFPFSKASLDGWQARADMEDREKRAKKALKKLKKVKTD